ncbi:MAG: biotin/lipoyl-binding protein, partial [Deltaproteobacteria bacterium]|jgi:biotin carboxyl carrier protein|nr:biotin/lipoyl-binding protein [Deltaproteobacteria bacterium]
MRYVAVLDGVEREIEAQRIDAGRYRVKLAGRWYEADLRRIGPGSFSVLVDGRCFDLEVGAQEGELIVGARAGTSRVSLVNHGRASATQGGRRARGAERAELRAMMPGRVVAVLVEPGTEVAAEQGLVVVEAMKMENELRAPRAGRVVEVKVSEGQTVEKGDLLAVIA